MGQIDRAFKVGYAVTIERDSITMQLTADDTATG